MPDLQPQPVATQPAGNQSEADRPDPLAKLYHMSTTAGVGTQEYVAINATAVVSLILGFGSILVFLSNVLLVVPLAGVICGLIAAIQIRRSNQTQAGMALAIGGILLCLGFGGGRAGYQVVRQYHTTNDERQIAQLMQQLGSELHAEHYDQAYALFGERFRNRISRSTFEQAFRGFRDLPKVGSLESIEWNHEPMIFEDQPGNDVTIASGMGMMKFSQNDTPARSVILFEKIDGKWQIYDLEGIFPSKKQPR